MISFRRLHLEDIDRLHHWLNEPGVVEWWEGDDVSRNAVRRDYLTDVDEGFEHWMALDDGEPIGWIQCYPVTAVPEEHDAWSAFGVPETTAGIDYLIGNPGERGRGRGSTMIDQFVESVVFAMHEDWTHAGASPFSANTRSWRALAKAGFTHVGTIADPAGPAHLMLRTRPGHTPADHP